LGRAPPALTADEIDADGLDAWWPLARAAACNLATEGALKNGALSTVSGAFSSHIFVRLQSIYHHFGCKQGRFPGLLDIAPEILLTRFTESLASGLRDRGVDLDRGASALDTPPDVPDSSLHLNMSCKRADA